MTLVTGKPEELDKLDLLAAGTHFLTAYGNKRGGKRKKDPFNEQKVMDTLAGMEDKPAALPQTEPRDTGEGGSHVSD
jgi:hypothetical protein